MTNMTERIIWILIVIILGYQFISVRAENRKINEWVTEQADKIEMIDSFVDDILAAQARHDSVTASDQGTTSTSERRSEVTGELPAPAEVDLIPAWEIRELSQSGLSNPVSDLKQSLISRPDLIRFDGVLGGTMRVYSKSDITLLPGGWAYATFEDGHINGGMLLRYSVSDGEISWEVIERKLF